MIRWASITTNDSTRLLHTNVVEAALQRNVSALARGLAFYDEPCLMFSGYLSDVYLAIKDGYLIIQTIHKNERPERCTMKATLRIDYRHVFLTDSILS